MGLPPTAEDWNAIEWFREGFVSYYGYLLALRAGFIQLPAYLESVNRDLRLLPARGAVTFAAGLLRCGWTGKSATIPAARGPWIRLCTRWCMRPANR